MTDRITGPLWTRSFILAIVTSCFMGMIFYLLMTTMAFYAVERFQASASLAGLASSAFIIGAVVARLSAGKLLEIVGRRRLIISALVVYVVMSALYIPAQDLGLLIAVRLVHGFAMGSGATAIVAGAQAIIPPARRGEGTAFLGMAQTLATAIGPFIALTLLQWGDYELLFAACVAFSALALIASLFLRFPELELTPEQRATTRGWHPRTFVEPGVLPVVSVIALGGLSYSGVLAFLNSYAESLDIATAAALFFAVYALVLLLTRPFAGRTQDRRGDNVVVYPALVAMVAGMVVLASARDTTMMLIAAVLLGFGFGNLTSTIQAISVRRTPAYRVGLATSTYFFALDLGTGIGPVVLGAIVAAADFSTMYLSLAGVMMLAGALYTFVHGRSGGRSPRRHTLADAPTGGRTDPVSDESRN
ncbi:MFS transporter [Occultella kanbiaonis]|uniref:MFS transporter n=1 Tax=Occultella kanbiaonis TaxID=2675754 RepID=UPI001E3A4779|nr:MFS transporter [Occultella kanbiaonis]